MEREPLKSVARVAGQLFAVAERRDERVYMREFLTCERLPDDIAHWTPLVQGMLNLAAPGHDGVGYLMIDQGWVPPGKSQRRPGVHIDGYWDPGIRSHSPRHRPTPPHHSPRHRPTPPHHSSGGEDWSSASYEEPEGIVLWSNFGLCTAWNGEFEGPIGEGGDCTGATLGGGHSVRQDDYDVLVGNVTMMHESMENPYQRPVYRTLVRINLPGWTP